MLAAVLSHRQVGLDETRFQALRVGDARLIIRLLQLHIKVEGFLKRRGFTAER